MTTNAAKEFLLWCVCLNYGVLLIRFGFFIIAHDQVYRIHRRWIDLPVESFDVLNYTGFAAYKIGIIVLNLAPLLRSA